MKNLLSFFLTFLFFLSSISLLSSNLGITEYLSADQGLSQNEVTTVLQDRNGFMWFGTRGGLNRYDGYEFVQFNSKAGDENHLSNPSIESMFEDRDGNFWVGTKSGGLNFYNTEKESFSHITHFGKNNQKIEADRIIRVDQSPNGNIFIGTWPDGMFVLDYERDSLLHFFKGQQIKDFYFDNKGFVWIGANGDLYKMNLEDYSYESINIGVRFNINEMVFDGKNGLWIVGWGMGLINIDLETLEYTRYRLQDQIPGVTNNTYSIIRDHKGRIWVGTWGNGLYVFNLKEKKFERVSLNYGSYLTSQRQYDIILDIYEDRHDNIWIACDPDAIVKFGGNVSFKGVSAEQDKDCGLSSFHILSMYEANDSSLFIGTYGGGLYHTTDRKNFKKVYLKNENSDSRLIKHIFEYDESTLWIFTSTTIFELDLNTIVR